MNKLGSWNATGTLMVAMMAILGLSQGAVADDPGDPPSSPWGVVAIAVNETAHVLWQEPLDDGGSPIYEYVVYRAVGLGEFVEVGRTSATEFLDEALGATDLGVPVLYVITAVNAVGESVDSLPGLVLMDDCITARPSDTPPAQIHPEHCTPPAP